MNGSGTKAHMVYLFKRTFRCPVAAMQSTAARCVLQKFEDIFNWTPGIRLKSLWTACNQKFIWDIFKRSHLSSKESEQQAVVQGAWFDSFICAYVRMFVCFRACMVLLCTCLSLSLPMYHKLLSVIMQWVDMHFCHSSLESCFPKAHRSS